MIEKTLIIKFFYLVLLEGALFFVYTYGVMAVYRMNMLSLRLQLALIYEMLNVCVGRLLALLAIANVFLNDDLASLYIFFGLELLSALYVLKLAFWPGTQLILCGVYMLLIMAQIAFVIVHYDKIIRRALWRTYKIIGSDPTLQCAYNVRMTMIAVRLAFYVVLFERFDVFVLGLIYHPTPYGTLSPYFYILPLCDACICFYESHEVRVNKIISLALIVAIDMYFVYTIIRHAIQTHSLDDFTYLVLNLVLGLVYLIYSSLDFFYYGSGLRQRSEE
jgi:hypothetical protein